jgi:hypothetical protein
MLRAHLRSRLRSAACDDAAGDGDPVSDRMVLAVDELTSNGMCHGVGPVEVRIVGTEDGGLIDIRGAATERGPELAVGRNSSLGGMGCIWSRSWPALRDKRAGLHECARRKGY